MMTSRRWWYMALVALLAVADGCGTGGEDGAAGDSGASEKTASGGARTGVDRSACDLLTEAEVSAAVGAPVKAKETHRESGRSDCGWFDASDLFRMGLVGYWTAGPEGWDVLAGSLGMAKAVIQKEEGVSLDSVVPNGPVSGLGDKAFFSPLLPSLVLKDQVLLEFTIAPLDNPAAHFRPLATKALSRL
jgi:hypothetical protein